jgi:hypothetical protein
MYDVLVLDSHKIIMFQYHKVEDFCKISASP